jgi:hypothetical protein
MNVIPERIIFVSRGITVLIWEEWRKSTPGTSVWRATGSKFGSRTSWVRNTGRAATTEYCTVYHIMKWCNREYVMACLRNYVQALLAVVFRDMPRTGGITYTTSPLRGSVCSSPLYVRMWHGKHITLRCDADVRPTCSRSQKEFKHPHKNRFPVRITKPPNLLAKDKAIPLQAWTGPEGSKKLRLPDFQDNRHMNVARLSALHTGHLYPPADNPRSQWC